MTPELMMVAYADLGATRGAGLCGDNRENLEKGLDSLMHGYTSISRGSCHAQALDWGA